MPKFISKHPAVVVTIALHLIFAAAGLGYFQANFDALREKVRDVDQLGATGRETRWIVDRHARDIDAMQAEMKRQGESIAEIRSDVKLIAAWVRQQQERDTRADARTTP